MDIIDCWAYGLLATMVVLTLMLAAHIEMIWICICMSAMFLFTIIGGIHFGEGL